MADAATWGGLARRLAAGMGIAILLVLLGRIVGLAVQPVLAVLLGALGGAVAWVIARLQEPPRPLDWQQPQPPDEASAFTADVRTRRLATMLSHAQPGQGFDAGALATTLARLTTERLVRNHRLPAEGTIADAGGVLSPGLLKYFRAAETGRAPTLNRRALHAHLKEIDEL